MYYIVHALSTSVSDIFLRSHVSALAMFSSVMGSGMRDTMVWTCLMACGYSFVVFTKLTPKILPSVVYSLSQSGRHGGVFFSTFHLGYKSGDICMGASIEVVYAVSCTAQQSRRSGTPCETSRCSRSCRVPHNRATWRTRFPGRIHPHPSIPERGCRRAHAPPQPMADFLL